MSEQFREPDATQQFPAYGQPAPYAQQPAPYAQQPAPYAPGYPQAAVQPYAYGQMPTTAMPAPYGVDPLTGLPFSDKSKVIAGVLQILFGGLGVGRFYLGNVGMALGQIAVTIITVGIGVLWPIIDGIVLLAGNPRDKYGRPLRS